MPEGRRMRIAAILTRFPHFAAETAVFTVSRDRRCVVTLCRCPLARSASQPLGIVNR